MREAAMPPDIRAGEQQIPCLFRHGAVQIDSGGRGLVGGLLIVILGLRQRARQQAQKYGDNSLTMVIINIRSHLFFMCKLIYDELCFFFQVCSGTTPSS
jgi:hypothetical protein